MGSDILPKNDHQNDKTLGWPLWHLGFTVSTVVRNKVTKTVPGKQLLRTAHAIKESNSTRELPPPPPPPPLTHSLVSPLEKKKGNMGLYVHRNH